MAEDGWNARGGVLVLLACLCGLPGSPQSRVDALAPGKFLVAPRDSADPNFAQAAVLLVNYDGKGAMGLIINRPTDIPLSRVFREMKAASGRSDTAYLGGPVSVGGVLALVRSRNKREGTEYVFEGVYLVTTKPALEREVAQGGGPEAFRVYLGYAGWGPKQLDRELEFGMWHVVSGDAETVFDPKPGQVWRRLIERTEQRIAFRITPPVTTPAILE